MPDETVIDGEVVALDEDGRPSFNALQNHGSVDIPLHFFIFDLLMLQGRDVMAEPLVKRRELIENHVLPKLADPIRYSPILKASLPDLIRSVKAQGLEGLGQSAAIAGMSPACAQAPGRRCASIGGRSL
jgi:bifunctional non-homologous end joining protein LigD